jgi:putative colanic acid biosynthesis UDP-glucose lipid carrier transferase
MAATTSRHGFTKLDIGTVLFLVLAWYFSSKATNLYDDLRTSRYVHEFLLLFPNVLIQGGVLIVALFMLNDHYFARTFVMYYIAILLVLISVKKYVSKKLVQYFRMSGKNLKNILIIGANETGMSFHNMLKNSTHYGYKVVGFMDQFKPTHLNGLYKGDVNELDIILQDISVDEVIVAVDEFNTGQLQEIIRVTDKYAVKTRIIPDYFKFNTSRFSIEMFGRYPLVTVRSEPLEYMHWRVLKRALDFILSFIVTILILSWLMPLIALLIKLDSKGDVFFSNQD